MRVPLHVVIKCQPTNLSRAARWVSLPVSMLGLHPNATKKDRRSGKWVRELP